MKVNPILKMLTSLSLGICATVANASDAVTAGGLGDITILSVDIGHFNSGNKIIHVYENSRNLAQYSSNPEKWIFMVEPLLTPQTQDAGIKFETSDVLDPIYRKNGKKTVVLKRHRVHVPLDMLTEDAVNKAIEVINARYPEARCKIGPLNIDVLPVISMKISSPDIQVQGGRFYVNSKIATRELNYLTSPSQMAVQFDIAERSENSDTELKNFVAFMPFLNLEAELGFSVKSTLFNIASAISEKIKDTDLYVKLNGGGSETYVARDDLRRLTQTAASQLKVIQIIEDNESFDELLFKGLIESSQIVSANEEFFNTEQGKQTYDAEDLRPSVINSKISKQFDYDQGKDEWSLSTSASGGGDFLGLISADFSGSLSTSKMKEWLKQHSLETEITGNIIVVKSIDLQRVNLSKFLEKRNFGIEYRNIEKGSPKLGLKTEIRLRPVNNVQTKSYETVMLESGCTAGTSTMLNVR